MKTYSLIFLVMGIGISENSSPIIRTDQVAKTAMDIRPLLPGFEIPDVSVLNLSGDSVSLRSLPSSSPLVLVFYRGGWCPYCNLQLKQLKTLLPKLKEMTVPVIAISPDRPSVLKKSVENLNLEYQLLSDSKTDAAKAFGIAFTVDEALVKKYKSWNMDIEEASGQTHHILPVPAVFVISREGVITFSYANPNYKVRLDSKVLMAAVISTVQNQKMKPFD